MYYKKGQKISKDGGVAKITSVNPDGTATANWVKPPKNPIKGVLQKKGGWAATLPAMPNKTNNESDFNFNETSALEEEKNKKTLEEFLKTRLPQNSHEKIGLPNELNPAEARIRMHNILIKDHSFIQDPDDIPGGCKTCWDEINAYEDAR